MEGSELHSSKFTPELPAALSCRKTHDGDVMRQWNGGWQVGNTFASYLHLHFAQRPTLLNHWINAARSAL